MFYNFLAMWGGGPEDEPPQLILLPSEAVNWTEIAGVVMMALSIIVTIAIFYIRSKRKK